MTSDDAAALARVEKTLEDRFPMRIVPGLSRIGDLLDLLGSPQRAYPSIHVTGTNGKTSTTRMAETLLRTLGLRTGRYTSPHLESVTERISVDGEPLSPERFAAVYDDIAPYVEIVDGRHEHKMSFFEVLTGMAFAAFADAPVEVAVVEVGLGGRWDATNVINAPVCVITPIGLDHVGLLGDTVEAIAAEKADIVHEGALLVAAQQPLGAAEVLMRRVAAVGATVAREGIEFGVLSRAVAVGGQLVTIRGLGGVYEDLFMPLHGAHQAGNAACALAAVEGFFGAGGHGTLDEDAVRQAFASFASPGRLEVVRQGPTVVLDGAHNPHGVRAMVEAMQEAFSFQRLVGVVGCLSDKDVPGMLEGLEPLLDAVVCTQNSSPRAMPADELGALAVGIFGAERVEVVPRLDDALDAAIRISEEEPELVGTTGLGVLVTGSVVTVGDARRLLHR